VLGNGGSLAYLAERSGQRFIVLDGKGAALPDGASPSGAPVIRPGGGVGVLVTSVDGRAFLHEAFAGGEGPASSRHDEAADLAYGAGGATAYAARRGDAWFVVANGTEGPALDRVVSPAFSPDGKLLVYRARKDGKRFVVIADRKGETVRQLPPYEQVFPVRFDADGKSIAYGVKDGPRLLWLVEPLPSR
jgi:hypothetical protein